MTGVERWQNDETANHYRQKFEVVFLKVVGTGKARKNDVMTDAGKPENWKRQKKK